MTAGLETLRKVLAPGFFEKLGRSTRALLDGLGREAKDAGVGFSTAGEGGMFGLFFRAAAPASFAEVMQCDRERFNRFFHAMLANGVYLAPSAFEAGFVSAAHTDADFDATFAAARKAFACR